MSKPQPALINSLPGRVYTDPGIFQREQERIFGASWQFACHLESLKNKGDFTVCDIAGESLILIRESEATINAFYNVCLHRAARLLEGEGCRTRFSCPYHAWTYNTRGELVAAPNSENVPGFELDDFRLRQCQVEVVQGLVFVNLDDAAESLRTQVPGLIADLEFYAPELELLTFVHRTETVLQANWKVAIENYAECYHCELIHRELVDRVLDFDSYKIEVIGRAHKHRSKPQSGAERAYQFDESRDTEFVAWWMWPNFSFQSYPGGRVHVWKWTPLDVENTRLTVDWYFPSRDMEEWEQELIRHHAANTFAEDQDVINSTQRGLGSRGYVAGPLMIDAEQSRYSEHAVASIQQYWRDAMGDEYEQ